MKTVVESRLLQFDGTIDEFYEFLEDLTLSLNYRTTGDTVVSVSMKMDSRKFEG